MAKKKSMEERVAAQIKKMLPEGMIPDSYVDYVVMENMDLADSEAELMGDVKMQLYEESGFDMPMSRKETEGFLLNSLEDEQWEGLSHDNVMSTSQVKVLNDSYDKTMLEMIKELPLIPAARMISSIVVSYLRSHGQEVDAAREEDITEDMIHTLGTDFSDIFMDGGLNDLDMDWEEDLGIEFDFEDEKDLPFADKSDPSSEAGSKPSKRRNRITKFPGKS